jgi:two-component sensor histidine kinase
MALTLVEQMECDERDGTLARIRAIGLVYDMVEGQENLSVIALGEYLQSLSSSLSMLYGATPVSIRFAADGTLEAGLDSTVNTGLMLVELVDLARRHSFSAEGGEISVSQKLGEEMVELVVTHAGGRLPDSVDPGADRFFTTGLLPAFFERLQVSATLERGGANEWTLTMPASVFHPHKGDSAVLAS